MTAFLLYFETKNEASENYSGYADVGNFIVPKSISAGEIKVLYSGKRYRAGMISNGTHLGSGEFFTKNKNKDFLVSELKNFICNRQANDCVVCNLSRFIYKDQKVIKVISIPRDISILEFDKNFDRNFFEKGNFLRIS